MIDVIFLALIASVATSGDDYIEIENAVLEKSKTDLIRISGVIDANRVNMTLIHPDGTIQLSTTNIASGTLSNFILPDSTFDSGLYKIEAVPYTDETVKNTMRLYFFLYDEEGLMDVSIPTNAIRECEKYDEEGYDERQCMDPPHAEIPRTFGVKFINDDYKVHNIRLDRNTLTGDIETGNSKTVFFQKSGNYEFHCIYHPWVKGSVTVSNLKNFAYEPPAQEESKETPKEERNISGKLIYDTTQCEKCHIGRITAIPDGDTIYVDNERYELAFVDAPNRGKIGHTESQVFAKKLCPDNSLVLVDVDDLQPEDEKNRIAVITCVDVILNEQLLTSGNAVIDRDRCRQSEFSGEPWIGTACDVIEEVKEEIEEKIPEAIKLINDTAVPVINDTINDLPEAVKEAVPDLTIIVISISVVILVCIILALSLRKKSHNYTVKDANNFNILE